jgi:hypothetical protein
MGNHLWTWSLKENTVTNQAITIIIRWEPVLSSKLHCINGDMLSPRYAVSKYKGQSCYGIKIIPQQMVLEE